jgi:hypothetical protein
MKFQPQAAAADLDLMATCSKSAIIVDVTAGWKRRGQAGRVVGVNRGAFGVVDYVGMVGTYPTTYFP